MNLLITGKLDSITKHLITAAGNSRIILAADSIPPGELPSNVRTFSIKPEDPLFQRVIKVGSFDAAVFFMARGEHTNKGEGGVTAFQSMLEQCVENGIAQIILISSGEVYSGLSEISAISETTPASPAGTQGFQIKAAEDMCLQHWQHAQTNITVVRLPYIYQRDNAADGDGLLAGLFRNVLEGRGKLEFPGAPETACDFLSDLEAARLVWLIIDEGISSRSVFVNAGSGKSTSFGEIAGLMERYFPEVTISYSGDTTDVPPPMRAKIARSEYGWNALNSLVDDFVLLKDSLAVAPVSRFAFLSKITKKLGTYFHGSKGFIIVEFVAATALLQFLSTTLRGFTFSNWIDLRLVFVVILSTLHGTIPGIFASIIAGIMLFVSLGSFDWRMIVYNPENWIPFALYMIMGVALGSKADRQVDSLKATDDRLTLAEQTNIYLVELYDEAVRIKDNYRDQILGYKDNFGRIYSIVKKLNSEMSEYVFSSAVEVIEDVLESDKVAIYSMSANGGYARMTVCSKALHGDVTRSMRLNDFPLLMEKMEQRDIWFNRDLLPGYPTYCAPVFNDETLLALVMIWRTDVDQMTLHFNNLFKILSGLIQESLVRAVKFNKLRESTSFYPDTRIMLKEPFKDAFKANVVVAEQEKAEFCLFLVDRAGTDMIAQNTQLEACVRESDVVGAINDTVYGVILKNVSSEDIETLLKRFKSKSLKAWQVSVAEMNELIQKEAG